jgi:hypothetical protein
MSEELFMVKEGSTTRGRGSNDDHNNTTEQQRIIEFTMHIENI